MPEYVAGVIVAYLLGSVSGSLLLGRLRGVDIRTLGSGNAGGTNALRTQGWLFALGVVIVDVGKGALAAWGVPLLVTALPGGAGPTGLAVACGLAAVVGHVWPVFFRFRGGKGAGTSVGAVAVIAPWCLPSLLGVWLLVLVATGYVGLATVLAGISLVPSMWLLGPEPLPPALAFFAVVPALLLVLTHRSNIRRMLQGDESAFVRARLFRRRR